jgi:hypothetical protein
MLSKNLLLTLSVWLITQPLLAHARTNEASPQILTPLPQAVATADSWVPVVFLRPQNTTTIAPFRNDTLFLGFAQVRDIQNGFPYKVGFYKVEADAGVKIGNNGRVFLNAQELQATPLCDSTPTLGACQPLIGVMGSNSSSVGVSSNATFGSIDLSLGLSHQRTAFAGINPNIAWPSGPLTVSLLSPAGMAAVKTQNIDFASRIKTTSGQFGFGLSVGRGELLGLPGNSLNSSQMQINWLSGAFSSALTTQLYQLNGAGSQPLWGGVDLGVSWRTPWEGVVSLGAKGTVSRNKPPRLLDPNAVDDVVDSMPYVRYEQDL